VGVVDFSGGNHLGTSCGSSGCAECSSDDRAVPSRRRGRTLFPSEGGAPSSLRHVFVDGAGNTEVHAAATTAPNIRTRSGERSSSSRTWFGGRPGSYAPAIRRTACSAYICRREKRPAERRPSRFFFFFLFFFLETRGVLGGEQLRMKPLSGPHGRSRTGIHERSPRKFVITDRNGHNHDPTRRCGRKTHGFVRRIPPPHRDPIRLAGLKTPFFERLDGADARGLQEMGPSRPVGSFQDGFLACNSLGENVLSSPAVERLGWRPTCRAVADAPRRGCRNFDRDAGLCPSWKAGPRLSAGGGGGGHVGNALRFRTGGAEGGG